MTAKKTLKDVPLQEITLRKYEEPIELEKDELIRKFCLSLGLLQPGESRDILVDILGVLLENKSTKTAQTTNQIFAKLKDKPGASASNLRRQLRRLKELKIIEKVPEGYRITEFGPIEPQIEAYVVPFIINTSLERIKQYAKKIDEIF